MGQTSGFAVKSSSLFYSAGISSFCLSQQVLMVIAIKKISCALLQPDFSNLLQVMFNTSFSQALAGKEQNLPSALHYQSQPCRVLTQKEVRAAQIRNPFLRHVDSASLASLSSLACRANTVKLGQCSTDP